MSEDQPNSKKHSNNMVFVLVAAAAGAVAGLLFAPKRGEETRKDLKIKYDQAKNKSQDVAESAHAKVAEKVDVVRSKIHRTTDNAEDMIDEAADNTKNAVDKAADKAKSAADNVDRSNSKNHTAM